MTWLTITEYLCHKWLQVCSICRDHILSRFSFIKYHQIVKNACATSETGIGRPSLAFALCPWFFGWWGCSSIFSFLHSVVLIIVCLFVLFLLAIVLSVLLRCTTSDYPFDIFKLFLLVIVLPVMWATVLITPLISSNCSCWSLYCLSFELPFLLPL